MVRQRGTKYHPGTGVGIGRDHTIFATSVGFVRFRDELAVFDCGKSKERKVQLGQRGWQGRVQGGGGQMGLQRRGEAQGLVLGSK